jgi:sugar lactone lactonase YvrE
VPESPANLALGGSDLKTLYLIARKLLYAIPVGAKGVR